MKIEICMYLQANKYVCLPIHIFFRPLVSRWREVYCLGVFEDLKFKISDGSDQNWCVPGSAHLAVSV